jgi:deoxycytidine triphosphate deaminase
MYRSGAFVADHVTPTTDEQVQPNGVDLRLEAVFEQREPGRIRRDGKEVGDRQPRHADPAGAEDGDGAEREGTHRGDSDGAPAGGTYYLPPGGYVVRYVETVAVPEEHVGFVYPRSSLLRNSCMLNTAVWDAGYEGKGEGLLQVHHDVEIECGARLAQLVFADADHEGTYDGSYQKENL